MKYRLPTKLIVLSALVVGFSIGGITVLSVISIEAPKTGIGTINRHTDGLDTICYPYKDGQSRVFTTPTVSPRDKCSYYPGDVYVEREWMAEFSDMCINMGGRVVSANTGQRMFRCICPQYEKSDWNSYNFPD
jgi:hypothetical protein